MRGYVALLGVALTLTPACGWFGGGDRAAKVDAEDVKTVVTVAKAIKASPDRAEEILAEHELTLEQFEARLYAIALNPKAAEEYTKQLGKE